MRIMIKSFKRLITTLNQTATRIKKEKISFEDESDIGDYENSKSQFYQNYMLSLIKKLKEIELKPVDMDDIEIVSKIIEETRSLNSDNLELLQERCNRIADLLSNLKKTESEEMTFKIPKLPDAIHGEVVADLKEIKKCFESGSYRGCTILCGRILETVLHRKYYETTQRDILETNPGIGLGTLIGKLREKGVRFEPGLSEQIHLINQVRINSVHKKKQVFMPSKEQAYAIILFSLDILKKMF
jgi:hypothetical protein